MNEFENMIKECLYKEFGHRIEKYGYFDAKEFIELDCNKLERDLKDEKYENFLKFKEYKENCIRENERNRIKNNGHIVGLDFEEIEEIINYGEVFYNKYIYESDKKSIDRNVLNNIVKFFNDYYKNSKSFKFNIKCKYVSKLILLFVFNNIELLSEYISIKETIHSIMNPIEGLMRKYLDNNIKQLDTTNNRVKIFYIESKVKINIIYSIQNFLEHIKDTNKLYFRGHSRVKYGLLPSAFREENFDEKYEIENTCAEYPNLFNNLNRIDILSVIQHYGGKTRLLDITENPLVALYFACCDHLDEMGEIIMLTKNEEFYSKSDTLAMLSALSFLGNEKLKELREAINNKCCLFGNFLIKNKVVLQLEHLIRQERLGFKFSNVDALKSLNDCVYYKANMGHERIIRQSGRFILCGIDIEKTEEFLNNLRKKDEIDDKKCIYLISNKRELKEQLKVLGIDYHYLFPEIQNYFINSCNNNL